MGQRKDWRGRITGINLKHKSHNIGSGPAPNPDRAATDRADRSRVLKIAVSRQSPAKEAQVLSSAKRGGCVCQRKWRAQVAPLKIIPAAGADDIAHRLQARKGNTPAGRRGRSGD